MKTPFIGRLGSDIHFINRHLVSGYKAHCQQEVKAGERPMGFEDFKASIISSLFNVPLMLN